jgi:hypothetical protein
MTEQREKKSLDELISHTIGGELLEFDLNTWKQHHQNDIQQFKERTKSQRMPSWSAVDLWRTIAKSKITKLAAAAVIIVVAILIAVEHVSPEVPAPREDFAARIRQTPMVVSDAQLHAELIMVRKMIAAGDIEGLVPMLAQGQLESRILTASYLAKIGDLRGNLALEELAAVIHSDPEAKAELSVVRRMFAVRDADALVMALERGKLETRILAVSYLARIGDQRGIAALDTLPAIISGESEPNGVLMLPAMIPGIAPFDSEPNGALILPTMIPGIAPFESEPNGAFVLPAIIPVDSEPNGVLEVDTVVERPTDANASGEPVAEKTEAGKPEQAQELDGREVVVRLYKDWRNDPAAYEKAITTIFGRTVKLAFADVDDDAVAVVVGEDQQDQVLRELMGQRVCGWPYKTGLEFSLYPKAPRDVNDLRWTFVDALGNPIPNAAVEFHLKHGHEDEPRQVLIDTGVLDKHAQLQPRFSTCGCRTRMYIQDAPGSFGKMHPLFVFSHPDYGVAEVMLWGIQCNPEHEVVLPFVPPETEAYERCVWGVVVDTNGNPVSGALVEPTKLVTPHFSGMIRRWRGWRGWGRTDEQGRFRLYLPVDFEDEKMGTLIPPKTRYSVRVTPPEGSDLLYTGGHIPNGQDNVITLQPVEKYFHSFVFEDEYGPITDLELLRRVRVKIVRHRLPDIWIKNEDFKDGGNFPTGTYQAKLSAERRYPFMDIEVTADSPEQLLFQLPGDRLYYGRVVHGLTGEPIEGAFVIDSNHTDAMYKRNLSMLTDQQWQTLHNLPPYVSRSNNEFTEALMPVCYPFTKIVRTDADGRFELNVPKERVFDKIVVFQEDYLTILTNRRKCNIRHSNYLEVPLTKLFPAATVCFELCIPDVEQRIPPLSPEIHIDKQNISLWPDDFKALWLGGRNGIRHRYPLQYNQRNSFYIPAGLHMKIELKNWSRGAEKWAVPLIAENIMLQQGETLDVGRVEIQPTIVVFAEALNSAGKTLEGVPVQAVSKYGTQTSYTDEHGIALFYLAQNSTGQLVVEYRESDEPTAVHLRRLVRIVR